MQTPRCGNVRRTILLAAGPTIHAVFVACTSTPILLRTAVVGRATWRIAEVRVA